MAANSITTEKLVAGAITTDKVAANAIVAGKIASGAITTDKLAALAVTADKLAANSVVAGKLAANSVDAGNIVAGAVTVDKLAANSVDASKIVAGAISTDKLAALSVTADKLAANSVNASKIVSQSITGDEIASNTIVARNIAAQSITSDKVAAGQFVGYVFTGSIFQSSTADNTGWKLKGNALDMWDSKRNHTVHLDGEGANNLLTGTFQTGLSGNRVMISPSFQQYEIGGPDKLEGAGIQFYHGTNAYMHPYIAVESTTLQEGEVSALTFNGGHRAEHDPGAFGRIGERKDDAGRKFSVVYFDANRNYDESVAGNQAGARIFLEAHPEAGNTFAALEAYDVNGKVGVQADINQGYLYMSGFLGGFTGRATFGTAFWKAWWGGAGIGYYSSTSLTYTPAKYGYYRWVVNPAATVSFATAHTGGDTASSTTIYGYGERGQDVYVSALAYLRK